MAKKARVRTPHVQQIIRRIGRQVRKARDERGLTQTELAEMLDFTWGTSLQMIEQGINPLYAFDIERLSNIFDKPLWWWFGRDVWPRDLNGWVILARGDRQRALAHFELDQQLAPKEEQ